LAEVITEQDGQVRYIRLNRPEKMNAINQALAWGTLHAIEDAQADENTWVIGLTGTGKAFCAGLDLTAGEQEDASGMSSQDSYLDDLGWVSRFTHTLRNMCDKPVVCGINGVAVGAGLALAMAGDIKIMAENARLMAGYPRIGGSPDGGLSYTLGQALGYEQAMRFLLENRTVLGAEALAMGMVGEVVADEQFDARFRQYCQQLTAVSPITARSTKRVVRNATRHADLEGHLRYELVNIRRAFASEDGREARAAFVEKRAPTFKGR
jgi:2-(1,2-epoxy-1,2-dihydrophenyl)acetyl-CoA isomerase